jgi:hypothetical protein
MRLDIRNRTLLATAAVAVAAACALAASALGATPAVLQCSPAKLRLKFVALQLAAGRGYIDYAWSNAGTVTCSLRGYPPGVLLDRHGHAIPAAPATVALWPLSQVRTVLVGPGQRAFFTFTWGAGNFCPGRTFTFFGLRVAPRQDATSFTSHIGMVGACDNSVWVTAVRPELFPF